MGRVIRVAVVDDDPLVRSILSLMLGHSSDIELTGEASDGRAGVRLCRETRPDVVLMDIRMPVMNGLEATRIIQADPFPPRVIILTTLGADEQVLSAVAAGADSYLLKDSAPSEIVRAIRVVADGDPVLSPVAAASVMRAVREDADSQAVAAAKARLDPLTDRELAVALAIAQGLSNAEIATALHISLATVKAHISRIFDKLGTTNRVQIAMCVRDAKVG